MKKSDLKIQRKELIKNRQISSREIDLTNALWESKVILSSEDLMWRSKVYDDTNFLIKSMIDLTNSCIELKIQEEDAKQLRAELSLNNNIEIETDKWRAFCISLTQTDISDKAKEVEDVLKVYIYKHLKSRN